MNDTLGKLRAANPNLNIQSVESPEFLRYGWVLDHYDAAEIIARAESLGPTSDQVVYEPSVEALERPCAFNTAMTNEVYGELEPQVGWCYGKNVQMAALEYHKGTEIDVCLTDVVLLVGHVQDINFEATITYDTAQVAAFYAPAGSIVELPAWNLHFAPIQVYRDQQFATLVYLPRGTNEALAQEPPQVGQSRLLFAVNKWLIAHPAAKNLVSQGAYPGMIGDDIFVNPI